MTTLREQLEFYGDSGLLRQLRRERPKDYEDFISVLYDDLDELLGLMEADAKDLIEASEDELNRQLVRLLNARTYVASHDHDEGGHVDIHVRPRNLAYSWLGEAKLDNGPSYLMAGLKQLTDRYARGTAGHNCGGLLVYCQKDRISDRFHNWRTRLTDEGPNHFEGLDISDCSRRNDGLAFFSSFVLERMGSRSPKYQVRNIGVSLYRSASAA